MQCHVTRINLQITYTKTLNKRNICHLFHSSMHVISFYNCQSTEMTYYMIHTHTHTYIKEEKKRIGTTKKQKRKRLLWYHYRIFVFACSCIVISTRIKKRFCVAYNGIPHITEYYLSQILNRFGLYSNMDDAMDVLLRIIYMYAAQK